MSNQSPDQSLNQQVARLQGDLQNLVRVLMKGFETRLASYGVGAVEYTVLSVCMAMRQISIKDLRGLVPIDYGHLSRTTSRLEDMGLIEKVRLRGDRRVVNLRMTEEGLSLMPELTRRVQGYYALLVSDFSQEELAGYMGVIEKMIAGGEEEKETPMRGGGGVEDCPAPNAAFA